MELNRYLDLYLSESEDHLRLLNRAVLELEDGDAAAGIEEAFRAAHTLKGMSGTMGFMTLPALARAVENTLEQVRAGPRKLVAQLIDDLLPCADRLERAIAASASGEPMEAAPAAPADTPAAAARPVPTIASLLA